MNLRGSVATDGRMPTRIRPGVWLAAAIVGLALAGWWANLPFPTRYVPGLPAISLNGALGFGLLALAVGATQFGRLRAAALCALAAGLLAGAVGLQHLLQRDLGIDALLWPLSCPEAPGRMPAAVVAVVLLLALHWHPAVARRTVLRRRLAMLPLALSYAGAIGLMAEPQWRGLFAGWSIPAAAVALLLGLEVLRLSPAPSAPSSGLAGPLARRVLPAALLVPVAAGWALAAAPQSIGSAASSAALALVVTGALFALAVFKAVREVEGLELTLHGERAHLEQRVVERTEQWQRAQAQEAAARRQLALIVDSVGLAVVAARPDGAVVYLNDAARRLFGLADADPAPAQLDDLLPAALAPAHRGWVEAFAHGDGAARRMGGDRGVRIRRRDDVEITIDATIALTERSPRLVTVVMQDRSARDALDDARRARDRSEAAVVAKNELLARLNHDLRTPLNAVLGLTQLLEADPDVAATERSRRYLKLIVHASHSLRLMLQDLGDLSQVESGQLRLQVKAVLVAEVLDPVLGWLQPQAEMAGLVWPSAGGAEGVRARADPDRLQQILANLLHNAIKYNRSGGRVDVRVVRDADRVLIEVADTGIGLSPAQRERVFVPYDRVGREDSSIEGTGLGLSIARELARAMGGDLSVEAREPHGSRFIVSLLAA